MTESAPEIRLESDRTRVFHSPVAVAKSKSSSEAFTFRVMRRRRGGSSPGSAATLHPAPWLRAVSAVTPWAWRPVNSGRRPQAGGAHPSRPRPVPADRHPTRSTLRRPGAAAARSASADRRAAEARSHPRPAGCSPARGRVRHRPPRRRRARAPGARGGSAPVRSAASVPRPCGRMRTAPEHTSTCTLGKVRTQAGPSARRGSGPDRAGRPRAPRTAGARPPAPALDQDPDHSRADKPLPASIEAVSADQRPGNRVPPAAEEPAVSTPGTPRQARD